MKKYDMRLVVRDADAEPEAKAELYIAFDGITASQLQAAADMAYDQLDDLIDSVQPCKDCDASPPTWIPKEMIHERPGFDWPISEPDIRTRNQKRRIHNYEKRV